MFAMTMLLLTSDWLTLVTSGDGSSHHERRFTDSVGLTDKAAESFLKTIQNAMVTQGQPVQNLWLDSEAEEQTSDQQGSGSEKNLKGNLALSKDGRGKLSVRIKDRFEDHPIQLTSVLKPLYRVELGRSFEQQLDSRELRVGIEKKKSEQKEDGFQELNRERMAFGDAKLVRHASSSTSLRNASYSKVANTRVNRTVSASKLRSGVGSNISFMLNDLFGTVRVGTAFKQRNVICNVHEKRCLNGVCVSHVDICPDSPCSISNPFQCQNKWQCVSVLAPCNGRIDCDDGSDEQGCNRLSYPYSHNERIVVVASIIIVVIGTSLFCCLLIHVYRKAHQSNPGLAQNSAALPDGVHHPWPVLRQLQNLLSQLGLRAESNGRHRHPGEPPAYASYSFHSIAGRTVHMTRPGHHLQSDTIESFISSSETGRETVVEQEVTVEHRWMVEATEPPPSYDDAVNLHNIRSRVDSRTRRTYCDPSPPPTYESIFCISTARTIEV